MKNPPADSGHSAIPGLGRSHMLRGSSVPEPQLLSPCSAKEKPLQRASHALQLESSPQSPQLENSPRSNKDPTQPKIIILKQLTIIKRSGLSRSEGNSLGVARWLQHAVFTSITTFDLENHPARYSQPLAELGRLRHGGPVRSERDLGPGVFLSMPSCSLETCCTSEVCSSFCFTLWLCMALVVKEPACQCRRLKR